MRKYQIVWTQIKLECNRDTKKIQPKSKKEPMFESKAKLICLSVSYHGCAEVLSTKYILYRCTCSWIRLCIVDVTQIDCSLSGKPLSGSDAKAASLNTTMWSSAACSDWSIQSRLPDMWQAFRVTSTKWLTDNSNAVALVQKNRSW